MALTQKRTIQELFRKYYIQPSKKLGQNFLIDKKILEKITKEARLKKNDIVLEIGPGIGNLTQEIAKRVKAVIAIEKDPKMCQILKENVRTWECRNVKIIQGDILKSNIQYLISSDFIESPRQSRDNIHYKVVANLPFYLTAPVIRKFLETKFPSKEMILVVQKEVAKRICAKPPNMSILAVSVQFYAKPEIISYISKESFWPQPKVDSAIIKITPRQPAPYRNEVSGAGFREQFFRIVRAGFAHPRKQLANNLSSGLKLDKEKMRTWLSKHKINPERRAETLSLKDWLVLTKNFNLLLF